MPSDSSFGDILSQFEQEQKTPAGPAQAVEGTVVAIDAESVFVDVGRKIEGVVQVAQFRDKSGELTVKPGDRLMVSISGYDQGYYRLSTVTVERPKDWSSLQTAFSENRTIVGTVTEMVKGGLRVDVGVPAFLPASRSGARDAAEQEALVGQEIQCRIIKLEIAEEDVVVDRRVILEEQEKQARAQAFAAIQEGAVVTGTVRSITDFGAFVDLGGVDGLLHVTDMSWHRVAKPSDVVNVGDSVEVKILKVNPNTRKISVGMKQLVPEPWALVGDKYKTGDRVRGTVSRLTDFGAFVELEPGIDGLIHISELSWSKKVRKPGDVVKVGESVEVAVLGVNPAERRISLGLKQALGDPWEGVPNRYPPGAVVEGTVTSLQKFGAFVDMGDGIEGMIHIGDISREKRLNHPNEMLKMGQSIRAQVLEVDRERRRIRLGMKQLEPTNLDEYIAEHKSGEVVTGRVVESGGGRVKVELGEGVYAGCRLPKEKAAEGSGTATGSLDISALTQMLSARWKQGKTESVAAGESLKTGQIRSFRIVALDAEQKRIEVEVAG